MAINIIERAVTPYNGSANKVANKEQYSLFAPAANVNKPGMAGYDPTYFAVREQIVELSLAFLASIIRHVVMNDDIPVDGIKKANTIYSGYTHEVIDRRTVQGVEEKITVTGNLLVLKADNCITEILFAEGRSWTRRMFIDGTVVQSVSAFEPAFDQSVTYEQLAVNAVGTRNIKDANVTTVKIAAKAVTTEKIDDIAVTTEKLRDAAVTTEKIGDMAVTTEKIDGVAVTTEKLRDKAVTTEKLGDTAVTTEKLRDAAVTAEKLSARLLNRLSDLENNAFTNISYEPSTGVLIFTTTEGKRIDVDLPLELIVSGGRYDETDKDLILVLANGEEIAIPLDDITKNVIAYIDGIRDSIYVLQKAPPLAVLTDAILLTTPTIAIIAEMIN